MVLSLLINTGPSFIFSKLFSMGEWSEVVELDASVELYSLVSALIFFNFILKQPLFGIWLGFAMNFIA